MKLKLFGLIVFLIITPQFVGAQNTEPSPTPINVGQIMRLRNINNVKIQSQIDARNERKEERIQAREQKREEIQAKLTEKRQKRIMGLYARINNRIQAASQRMTKLADRILVRLDVLDGEGEDVADLVADVGSAKDLIEDSDTMLVSLEGTATDMLESDEPKAVYPVIKDSVTGIKDTLKDAHSILVSVITQIRGLRVGGVE